MIAKQSNVGPFFGGPRHFPTTSRLKFHSSQKCDHGCRPLLTSLLIFQQTITRISQIQTSNTVK